MTDHDDDFLHHLRQSPRPQYVNDLYRRLTPERSSPVTRTATPLYRRLALTAASFALLALVGIATIPSVRAQVQEVLRQIGVFTAQEAEALPTVEGTPVPIAIAASQLMSMEQANALLPAPMPLPAWVPDAFTLDPTVTVTPPQESSQPGLPPIAYYSVELRWNPPAESDAPLYLRITYGADENTRNWLTGPNGAEEVSVNGAPAMLIRGGFDETSGVYGYPDAIALAWEANGRSYAFNGTSTNLTVEQLIQIATSTP